MVNCKYKSRRWVNNDIMSAKVAIQGGDPTGGHLGFELVIVGFEIILYS